MKEDQQAESEGLLLLGGQQQQSFSRAGESETFFQFHRASFDVTAVTFHTSHYTLNTYHHYHYYYYYYTFPLLEIVMFAPFRLAADWKPDVKRFLLFQCQQGFVSTLRSEFCFHFKIVGKSSGRRYAHVFLPRPGTYVVLFLFFLPKVLSGRK